MTLPTTRVCCAWFVAAVLAMPAVQAEDRTEHAESQTEQVAPLTLARAIDAALAGNPELAAFAFELRAQGARIGQAALRPAAAASFEAENVLGSGEASGTEAAEWTFALSRVVELGGRRGARIAAAEAGLGMLEVQRQARQLDVLAEVTRRFIAVAAAQEELRLARLGRALAEQTLAASQRRVRAAKAPHVEFDRAHIAHNRARLEERRAEVELDNARTRLAALWGESRPLIAGKPFGEVRADLFALPAAGEFRELLVRLDASPNFLKFVNEARLRDAELRLAASLRRPDLAVSGGVRRFEASGDQALVASISVPLFSTRRAASFVAEARANRERVDAEHDAARVAASAALLDLHRQLRHAVVEAETLRSDMLPRMEEALEETRYAYERGRYGLVELLDAQREYLAIQQALIAAASDAHALRAEIERLTNAPLSGTDRAAAESREDAE